MEGDLEVPDGACAGEIGVPLTDTTRVIVQVVHFLVFPICTWQLWVFLKKLLVLRQRIWNPFWLLIGFIWLQIGSAIEIANHQYEGDWELRGFKTDLVNGLFYFFNFGAQSLMCLGFRTAKQGFRRCPSKEEQQHGGCQFHPADVFGVVFDVVLVITIPATPIIYAVLGRNKAISICSSFGALSGIGSFYRIWKNLQCLFGGIGFFGMAMVGVAMTGVYRSTCIEWLHVFIGGSFALSVIPQTLAMQLAKAPSSVTLDGGETPSDSSSGSAEKPGVQTLCNQGSGSME